MKYLFILLLFPTLVFGQTHLPQFFSNGMVLQQQSDVAIWGVDNPGAAIDVVASWNKKATAKADEKGRWKITIKTPKAGGPYTLTVNGSSKVHIKDILMGEVWFCSGQSNMERPMVGRKNEPVEGSEEIIKSSENPDIRVFTVAKNASQSLAEDVNGKWLKASPATTGNFSAVAYTYARKMQEVLKVPVGVIVSSWGGSAVEAWMDQTTVNRFPSIKKPSDDAKLNLTPTLLYNGMINPFLGLQIKGVIWYQGESNVSVAAHYSAYFSSLISSWRKNWGLGDFPFYFVQIAPFDYGKKQAAPLRDAQLKVMKQVPKTGMVVTLDLGSCKTIHPPKKREVGERLANWALANDYSKKGFVFNGPMLKAITDIKEQQIELTFDHVGNGLKLNDHIISGFEVAGADNVFYPAKAVVKDKTKLSISSEKVTKPLAVRYGYGNCVEGTLFNSAGLPAGPFKTDN